MIHIAHPFFSSSLLIRLFRGRPIPAMPTQRHLLAQLANILHALGGTGHRGAVGLHVNLAAAFARLQAHIPPCSLRLPCTLGEVKKERQGEGGNGRRGMRLRRLYSPFFLRPSLHFLSSSSILIHPVNCDVTLLLPFCARQCRDGLNGRRWVFGVTHTFSGWYFFALFVDERNFGQVRAVRNLLPQSSTIHHKTLPSAKSGLALTWRTFAGIKTCLSFLT
ncbi:hypothetical protein B0H19DRAFT_430166 [Mycena capillaripes]|nr:hypothetical protein B0H19DRAFT_430166 [Mycena capillaripes]